MGLFDAVREKAAELLSGASDKVSELTGADLGEAQQNVTDSAQNLGDTATTATEDLTGTAQGYADTAQDTAADVTQNPAEYLTEDPRGRE
jgi:hypothetical protein